MYMYRTAPCHFKVISEKPTSSVNDPLYLPFLLLNRYCTRVDEINIIVMHRIMPPVVLQNP